MSLGRIVTILALASFVASTTNAAGDEAAADRAFSEGVALANQRRFDEAAARFEESYRLDPARGTLLALALAYQRGGKPALAYARYEKLELEARLASDAERQRIASEQLAALDLQIGRIVVATGKLPAGTVLEIDDRPVDIAGIETTAIVEPGDHRITARAGDGRRFQRDVALVAGSRIGVEPRLEAVPTALAPTPPKGRMMPTARESSSATDALFVTGWVALGLGVASGATSVALWARSGDVFDEVTAACRADPHCDREDEAAAGSGMEDASRVTAIVGGALGITGVVLVVVGWPRDEALAVQASPSGLSLRGSF